MEVKAHCERKADFWTVDLPEFDNMRITAKRLDKATEQVKDAIAEITGTERCEVIVRVDAELPGIICDLEAAQEKMREAARLQEQASAEIRAVVARMRAEGLTMRDIAVLLGVSPQRVAQLSEVAA